MKILILLVTVSLVKAEEVSLDLTFSAMCCDDPPCFNGSVIEFQLPRNGGCPIFISVCQACGIGLYFDLQWQHPNGTVIEPPGEYFFEESLGVKHEDESEWKYIKGKSCPDKKWNEKDNTCEWKDKKQGTKHSGEQETHYKKNKGRKNEKENDHGYHKKENTHEEKYSKKHGNHYRKVGTCEDEDDEATTCEAEYENDDEFEETCEDKFKKNLWEDEYEENGECYEGTKERDWYENVPDDEAMLRASPVYMSIKTLNKHNISCILLASNGLRAVIT